MATWDQLTFLTASQQALAAQFAAVAPTHANPRPPIGSLTQSQAKGADTKFRELMDLVGPAMRGADYVKMVNEEAAMAAYQAANPPP